MPARRSVGLILAVHLADRETLVKVYMIRKPIGSVAGVKLSSYKPGHTYDVDPSIANYLIVQGFAVSEMREYQRSTRVRATERRKRSIIC